MNLQVRVVSLKCIVNKKLKNKIIKNTLTNLNI